MAALAETLRSETTARRAERLGAGFGVWALGFAPVLYLGLRGGGFDAIVRQQVGVALWWLIAAGLACGVLSARRTLARGRWALLGLTAFTAWTAMSMAWTWSDERTAADIGRAVTYLGILVLACAAAGPRRRLLVGGVTTAIGAIAWVAVLSRLHP